MENGDFMFNPRTLEITPLSNKRWVVEDTREYFCGNCGTRAQNIADDYDGREEWCGNECTVCGKEDVEVVSKMVHFEGWVFSI